MATDRTNDPEYPRVYDTFTTSGGQEMVIQDLRPEDDDEVLRLMEKDMLPDETLQMALDIPNDPPSVENMLSYYTYCLQQRVSLGCYEIKGDEKHLVAVNVLILAKNGEKPHIDITQLTEKIQNLYGGTMLMMMKFDAYEHTGLDTLMQGIGLCVRKEYRGMAIGQKVLAAREPLCKVLGVKGTSTLFTGLASQKQAEKCKFQTIGEFAVKDMAEFSFPKDDERRIKYMIKMYDSYLLFYLLF